MDRDRPFTKYIHDYQEPYEVPLHRHTNGQLDYVSKGTMHLRSPEAAWVVPWQRIIWIPPDQLHSVRSQGLAGSWKIMIPRSYALFLPKKITILKTGNLLIAALDALPSSDGESEIPQTKLEALIEIIRQELQTAECESFGVTLPKSDRLQELANTLLENPADPRQIDDWAKIAGMSRRTFTRTFISETGSSFGEWKRNLVLGKALNLLGEGLSVSEISYRLGYANPSAFIVAFRKKYGVSPLKFTK